MGDHSRFLREFVRAPLRIGAIAPSSRALVEQMCAPVPATGDPLVVELGPGTGVFTAAIQRRLGGRGRHIAVELHAGFAETLAGRHPGVEVVCADAAALPTVLAERGLPGADLIVSGLPWSAFNTRSDRSLVHVIADALAAGGVYTQFSYTWTRWAPPSVRRLEQTHAAFDVVTVGKIIWRNLPPAEVYRAYRPPSSSGLAGR